MEESILTVSDGGVEEPLLEDDNSDYLDEKKRRGMLFRNFLMMAFAFSFNHGCVTSCLSYASSELGDKLGAYGGGFLYVAYSFSALALANPIVEAVGPKFGLVFGTLGYCIYIVGFLLAVIIPDLAWIIFLFASMVGGASGGVLWTAQGKYFAANAILYADASDQPVREVNSQFAGMFAGTYLGLEMVTKLVASGVYFGLDSNASAVVFTIYTVIAIISVISMMFISNLDEYGSWEFNYEDVVAYATAPARLLSQDVRLALMVPYQITFGLATTFVPYYIFGTVVSDSDNLGAEYIGVLSALTVFAGAAVSMPAAEIAARKGKPALMIFGGLCFAVLGMALYFVKDNALSRWRCIIPYLIVFGLGRGIWVSSV